MPTLILDRREPDVRELMDDPSCDRRKLDRTFAQFATLNRMIAGWDRIWRRHLRDALTGPDATVLDIGCGGGDVVRYLADLAERDGLDVRFTGIDPDERAIEFAHSFEDGYDNVRFRRARAGEFADEGRRFDAVISNHVLHHLDADERERILSDSRALARGPVVHNDIRRDDLAPALFLPARLLFRDSFIVPDGLRSIRRSYTADELRKVVGPDWEVIRQFPFRLLLVSGIAR